VNFVITHNTERSRFETEVNGEFAILDYEFYNDILALVHTFVPPKERHNGIAFALVKFALEYAKARNLKVIAGCSSVVIYIEQHPEYESLLATED
jgi:predicted GNAT family acetyltransferase